MRLIPPLDKYPELVEDAQTPAGSVLTLVLFAIGLRLYGESLWLPVIAVLAAIMFLPRFREPLVAVGTLYFLFLRDDWLKWDLIRRLAVPVGTDAWWTTGPIHYLWLSLILLIFAGFWYWSQRAGNSLIGQRPVLVLLTSFSILLALASSAPLPPLARLLLWTFLGVGGPYLWFFAYSLQDRRAPNRDSFPLQFRAWQPFWTVAAYTSVTPIPKGAANLRRIESTTPKELAVTRLKAIKLLYWALAMHVVLSLFTNVVHSGQAGLLPAFGLPTLEAALARSAVGNPYPSYICWASLMSHFVEMILIFASDGNCAIAICRMAGYRAHRFTYRPLEAGSVAEFWNRYHFYFKELLVEFFFYPTYLRYFRKHPRIRLAVATIAAAGFGNALFHFLRDIDYVALLGLGPALRGFQVYAFYAAVLAAGIVVSQLRQKSRAAPPKVWHLRVLSTIPAALFFCFLEIFDQEQRSLTLANCFSFFGQLFWFWR